MNDVTQMQQESDEQGVSRHERKPFEGPKLTPHGSLVPLTGSQGEFSAFAAES